MSRRRFLRLSSRTALVIPASGALAALGAARVSSGITSAVPTRSISTAGSSIGPGHEGSTSQVRLPSGETVLATLRPGHPRLLLLDQDLERIQNAVATDATARAYLNSLFNNAERIAAEPPVSRTLVGGRAGLLSTSRKVLERVYTLALLHRLDGDGKWAARAIQELLAAASFSDWNPRHFLDVAEMSHAVALGYDWLFHILSEQERKKIETALVDNALRPAEQAYRNKAWWAISRFNWNIVCNGGIVMAALAVADEVPELASTLLIQAMSTLTRALNSYAPDGAWPEGPMYWGYATRYTVVALAALESALGTDFGLSMMPGLSETGIFRLHCTGPTGLLFNFADAWETPGADASLFWLSRRYDSPLLAWAARSTPAGQSPAADLLWFDPRGTGEELAAVGLDARFKGAHLAFFRSAWADRQALYVGFKGGDNKAGHSHLDLGTFVLDALGTRWAVDLGPDEYDLPGYFGKQRYSYYRTGTEGQNTLTLDGQNQSAEAVAPIVAFSSSPAAAFAIVDLSQAYAASGASSARRGVALIQQRTRVLVQDELEAVQPVDAVWTMHTRANVEAGGGLAKLAQGGAELGARILSPEGARFQVEPVNLPAPQRSSRGVFRLVVKLPGKVTSTRIAVLFSPGSADPGSPTPLRLDQWVSSGPGL